MKTFLATVVLCLSAVSSAEEASAVRRLALLIGVNDGGPERARLRYAASDAQIFGKVLEQLGGVTESDELWVLESDRAGVLSGLEKLSQRADRARKPGTRVEVLLYYSGHSDEQGLLLRGQRIGYRELRESMQKIPADVRVAVIDSCASGALARSKGGVRQPAFLVDASAQVRGHAILTSSSETEVSQESDRLRGSFFTHYLVSGLRGAADVTKDGRVTLTEAYQFAFHETLARTEETRGGAQHPSYDIELAGAGDLVMTDLRSSSAGLVLAEALDGRIFVRDASGTLVVEVNKRSGASVDLGLPPGRYSVRREWNEGSALADVSLHEGQRVSLGRDDFAASATEPTALRGDAPPLRKLTFNLSLFPAISTNGLVPEAVENTLALGIATRSASLTGAALGLVGTWVDQDVRWFQGSLIGNVAGGTLRGGQFALGSNLVGAQVFGGQISGFYNRAGSDVTGFQFSPGGNVARGSVRGLQAGGLVNWAETASIGGQLAAGVNIARAGLRGAQVGLVNIGGDVTGAQIGAVNIARRARGAQFGLVNIADDVEGASIGLVSVVRQGQLHVELFGSDLQPVNAAIKMGSRRAYSTIFAGAGRQGQFLYGIGLGAHLGGERFWLDLDLAGSSVHTFAQPLPYSNILGQARAMVGFQLLPQLALFAGPTVNCFIPLTASSPQLSSYLPPTLQYRNDASGVELWPGVQVGARL